MRVLTINNAANYIRNRWPETWPKLDTLQRLAVAADLVETVALYQLDTPAWEIADEYRLNIGDNLVNYANTMVAAYANRDLTD